MLKLEEKNYDLNYLLGFNFDMLKEVLLKLAQNQTNLDKDIENIKDTNKNRDEKISSLEKQIAELNNYIINNGFKLNEKPIETIIKETTKEITEIKKEYSNDKMNNEEKIENEDNNKSNNFNNINNEKKESKPNVIIQDINKKETIIKENNIIPNNEDKVNDRDNHPIINHNYDNNKKDNNEMIKNINNYIEDKKDNNEIKENKENTEKKEKKEKLPIYKTSEEIIDLNSAVLQKAQISHELVNSLLQNLTIMKERMDNYEENFNDNFNECLKNVKRLLAEQNNTYNSKFNSIEKKIKDLYAKNDDANNAIDELKQKINELKLKNEEIYFNDSNDPTFNGDENRDEKKYMSNTFKESVNRKFALNDNRYMKAYGDSYKIKQNMLKLEGYIDKINRQITLLKNDNQTIKDNMEKITKNTEELIDNKNDELRNDIKKQIGKILKDVNNTIDKKVREFLDILLKGNQDNNNDKKENNNPINTNNFNPDNALIQLLNKKVNELSEKIGAIEDNILEEKKKGEDNNKDIEDLKKCMVEIYDNLNKKIGKDDLKELYDFYLDHVNQIQRLTIRIKELAELQDKMKNETPNIIKKLETLTYDISELQDNEKNKIFISGDKQLEFSNYITEKNLKNNLSPIVEEMEKLINEFQYINMVIKNMAEQMQFFEKKEHVDRIEGDLNEKINSLNNNVLKKFIEKIEFNKILKNIEIQIKLLQGHKPKEEAETWILAKQPLQCFNCASCEAIIANSSPPKEYLPWNKIPQGSRQYMIGQGFSKLLKKLNQNHEDRYRNRNDRNPKLFDNSQDNETGKYTINFRNDINDVMTINNRMANKEEKTVLCNIKKYKLPKVESIRRKQKSLDIPLTDDEKEKQDEITGKELNSPIILKIKKKKLENAIIENEKNIKTPLEIKNGNISSAKRIINSKLNRNQSVSIY